MMGRTHGLLGLTIGATAASVGHEPTLVALCASAGFLGSLLPDLDEPGSMITNLPLILVIRPILSMIGDEPGLALVLSPLLLPVLVISAVLLILLQGASVLTRALSGGHREATHSLWAWGLVSVLAGVAVGALHVAWLIGWAASAGYASHLLADGCTPMGLPWRGGRTHVLPAGLRIRTGGSGEGTLALAYTAVLALAWLTVLHPQSQQTLAALTAQGQALATQAQGTISHTLATLLPHPAARPHP